jgi:uncharacterized membrane protein YoaK (UPF0700 family)
MNELKVVKITESLPVGLELALVGGFMDAYTYINRGQVFATGQTGNQVLLGIRFTNRDYYGALMALVPIIFFILGVFATEYLHNKIRIERNIHWQSYILFFEIIILFLVGALPTTIPNVFANASIAFVSSLQFNSFRTLVNGPFATVFCTGNMRSCAENYYKAFSYKDKEALKSANRYGLIVLFFLSGGIAAAVISGFLFIKTIWFGCMLLTVPLITLIKRR